MGWGRVREDRSFWVSLLIVSLSIRAVEQKRLIIVKWFQIFLIIVLFEFGIDLDPRRECQFVVQDWRCRTTRYVEFGRRYWWRSHQEGLGHSLGHLSISLFSFPNFSFTIVLYSFSIHVRSPRSFAFFHFLIDLLCSPIVCENLPIIKRSLEESIEWAVPRNPCEVRTQY